MNFIEFFGMYLLCTLIIFLVYILCVRLFIRKKCNTVSRIAEKTIDDYFNAYDFPQDFELKEDSKDVNYLNR